MGKIVHTQLFLEGKEKTNESIAEAFITLLVLIEVLIELNGLQL
jgi:hypothetical protein